MMIQLANNDWIEPSFVGAVFADGEEVTIVSHAGETFFTDSFDSETEAQRFRDDTCARINQALAGSPNHLK